MCGIAGVFSVERPIDVGMVSAVLRMLDRQIHRGPNDWGILIPEQAQHDPAIRAILEPRGWQHVRTYPGEITAPAAVLGSRRLSILDLSTAGRMPMTSRDGSVAVVYNGEIYNFRELRDELRRVGHTFHSDTDTEVLLHGYQQWREDLPTHLRGMFAAAVLDARQAGDPKLFLFKDRFGIKPVYWARQNGIFQFASEVRALMAGGLIANEPEPRGVHGFLMYGSVPTPWTTIRGVMSLPAAESLSIDRRSYSFPRPTRYWCLPPVGSDVAAAQAAKQTRELLTSSVREQLVSDVPLGVFLSGGMDSSALVALAARHLERPLTTLCVTFDEEKFNEAKYAKLVADRFGTNHVEVRLHVKEFLEELPKFFDSLDQPTIDGVNSYFVAKAARDVGLTVVLSGLGGDELFWGYPGFRLFPFLRGVTRVPFASGIGGLSGSVISQLGVTRAEKLEFLAEHPILGPYLAIRGLFPPQRAAQILESGRLPLWHQDAVPTKNDRAQFSRLELDCYMQNQLLRDTDVFAMRHSVEVRVPFLDHRLVEFVTSLPAAIMDAGTGAKSLLAAALGTDYPAEVIERRKMGFTFPLAGWISEGWDRLATCERPAVSMIADRPFDRIVSDYRRDRRHWSQPWALAVFRAAEKRQIVPPLADGSETKRILFVLPQVYGLPGGIPVYNQGLLRAASEAFPRAELHVVSLNDRVTDPSARTRGFVHFVGCGPRTAKGYRLRVVMTLVRATARARPDLIVTGHINALPMTILLSALLRTPNILVAYGVEAWSPPKWLQFQACLADRILAVSQYTADRMKAWGVKNSRITVLPGMIDGEVFRPIGNGKSDFTILTVARLDASERYKGVDKVIEALQRTNSVRPVRYVVAGTGDDLKRLHSLADSLGVRHNIEFLGAVPEDDLPALYSSADMFLMPSKKEGFGIVFLEALACGTPVVAGNRDGSADALMNGAWGRLVNPDDVDEIASAIVEGPPPAPDRGAVLTQYGTEAFRCRLRQALESIS